MVLAAGFGWQRAVIFAMLCAVESTTAMMMGLNHSTAMMMGLNQPQQ